MPEFVGSIFATFPLVTYDPPNTTTPAPTKPTLWLLGPSPSNPATKESLDPFSRYALTLFRFSQIDFDVKYWSTSLGAPDAKLPALHLPNGDLISRDEITTWVQKQSSNDENGANVDASEQAYLSLVKTTLLPSILAMIYLSPIPIEVVAKQQLPLLSSFAAGISNRSERLERIAEIKKLSGGKLGRGVVLDLEELEREAEQTIEAVEVKLKELQKAGGKSGEKSGEESSEWWNGSEVPTELDAWLCSLLSILTDLPKSEANRALKAQLDRSPALRKWVQSKASIV